MEVREPINIHIKKRFKKEVISISVSYEAIKRNRTLGDFEVKKEVKAPDKKELVTSE
ncbi:hypothetical protein ACFLZ6_01690 [Nanoarchaeota archaeon]